MKKYVFLLFTVSLTSCASNPSTTDKIVAPSVSDESQEFIDSVKLKISQEYVGNFAFAIFIPNVSNNH